MKTALILGATGAVGKALLKDVLKNGAYAKVVAVGRREVQLDDSVPQDKLEQKTIDFDNLEAHREVFRNVNDVYCCLGTSRKEAGSAENFKKIDQGYVLSSAKIIKEENKPKTADNKLSPLHFLYCSSVGANKNSWFLYPQTKGQTEHELANTGFERVSIFRPGFLVVEEPRPKSRPLEAVFLPVVSLFDMVPGVKLSDPVGSVGASMRKAALDEAYKPKANEPETSKDGTKVFIYESKDI